MCYVKYIKILFFALLLNLLHLSNFSTGILIAQSLDVAKRSVVKIITYKQGNPKDIGAGIIISIGDEELYIITAYHVIEESDETIVKFYYNPMLELKGKIFEKVDKERDLAVLFIKSSNIPNNIKILDIGDASLVKELDQVIAIGHPGSKEWQASSGEILLSDDISNFSFSRETIDPGNSGGALLNDKYQLIGIVKQKGYGDGSALKIEYALKILDGWRIPLSLGVKLTDEEIEQIQIDIVYYAAKLSQWPSGQWPSGSLKVEKILADLSKSLEKVNNDKSFQRNYPKISAELFKIVGAYYLIHDDYEFFKKNRMALRYLKESIKIDPTQELLAKNILEIETMLKEGGGPVRDIMITTLQIMRGDDPEIPEIADMFHKVVIGNEMQAKEWLLKQIKFKGSGRGDMTIYGLLKAMQIMFKKETGNDFKIEITTKELENGNVEVQAKVGSNIFLWEVDYKNKKYMSKNKFTKQFMEKLERIKQ